MTETPNLHRVDRLRHELKRRTLTVAGIRAVTPNMLRITLTGPELTGFISAGHDDHVKLFFPTGPQDTAARDYTPRRHDPAANTLDIDFALHEAGPATDWALRARIGDGLTLGGPRGSFVVTDDFDWYLLVGDETALPAIGRRLEELRPDTRALVFAEVAGPAEEQPLTSRAELAVTWLHRGDQAAGDTTLLDTALTALTLPGGEGYVWIAGESVTVKRLRRILLDKGQPKSWLKAAGYWLRGTPNVHETIDD